MKKLLLYLSLGLIAYLLFMVVRFPAAPVISRFDLSPITLTGVTGPLWNGHVTSILAPNDSLPTGPDTFLLEDVSWRLAPAHLLKGSGAVDISFDAYGGHGDALVAQSAGGSTSISGFHYESDGNSLSVLLEPFAKIGGKLIIDVNDLQLENQLLESLDSKILWENATLIEPTPAKLGDVIVVIVPNADKHTATITATGGDLEINGSIDVELNGNFKSDITIKPSPGAPRELTDMLRGLSRPASDGSFRLRRSGNANRMM